MNIKWDADKYTKDFSFVYQYGSDVTELLDIDSNMTVLDLGCGSGALTKKLSDMGTKAIGLDMSDDLLKSARSQYPNLKFIQSDAVNFRLSKKVNAVFSNAVFHWIEEENQGKLLKCIYDALENRGQLVFEFGGFGNNQLIHSALAKAFEERKLNYKMPFFFPTIGQYSQILEASGFKVTYMSLFDRMTKLNGENGLENWIKMFVKKPFENVSDEDKNSIIKQTADMLKNKLLHNGIWYADYVRIRGKAIKE